MEKYISDDLVSIRDRLGMGRQGAAEPPQPDPAASAQTKQQQAPISNDREWKKAIFRRWDEFKNIRSDMSKRLAEGTASAPCDIARKESEIIALKHSAEQMAALMDELQSLDDSSWNRHNFTSELASSMKKLDNIRIRYAMLSAKVNDARQQGTSSPSRPEGYSGIIHELNSLTAPQLFRLGFAFFMPLAIAMFISVFIWGVIYYISLR